MAASSYTALEQNSLSAINVPPPTFDGATSSLYSVVLFMFTLVYIILGAIAVYRFAFGSLLRLEPSENNIRKSKEVFRRVVLGVLFVFVLPLILFTLNKDLITGNVAIDTLGQAKRGDGSVSPYAAIPPSQAAGAPSGGGSGQDAINDDPRVRALLKSMNIGVNKPVCGSPQQQGCTTVGLLYDGTLTMLSSLRQKCSLGTMIVSGGTEAGHSSHGPKKPPVDISINGSPDVESCVRSFTLSSGVPMRSDGKTPLCYPNKVYENFGYVFCDEAGGDRHWHVFK